MMRLKYLIQNTDTTAEEILKRWEYDEGSVRFWRGSSNFVHAFKCNDEKRFLRFSHEEENTAENISAELDFMNYLRKHGYPCVEAIRSNNGNYVETVQTDIGICHAVVFAAADGVSLEIDEMSKDDMILWGKSLGELHRLSMDYKPGKNIRGDWKSKLDFVERVLEDFPEEKDAVSELARVRGNLSSLPITKLNFGLIHYDFEQDNVFINNEHNRMTVIDFDDAMYHWYAMDIVSALGDLEELEEEEANKRLGWFLEGYDSVMPMDKEFITQFHKFKEFDRLYSFARMLRSMQNSNFPKDPEWLERLRPRLLRNLEGDREFFRR